MIKGLPHDDAAKCNQLRTTGPKILCFFYTNCIVDFGGVCCVKMGNVLEIFNGDDKLFAQYPNIN